MRYLRLPAYYVLNHKPTGYYYVGSTRDLKRRIANHRSQLEKGIHPNKNLLRVFTKWSDFEVHHVYRDFELSKEMEQRLLDKCYDDEHCCNLYNNAKGHYLVGTMPTDHPFRRVNIGRQISDERKEKTSRYHTGKTVNEETRELLRKKSLSREPGSTRKKAVVIDGVNYSSILHASRVLGVPHPTVRNRVKSEASVWAAWKWAD